MSIKAIYHNHHIIPVHSGGTNQPGNMIELTIPEHAEAHRTLWENNGDIRDYIAWKALLGQLSSVEMMLFRNQLAHEKKLKNGFYKKLGKLNSKRLKGVSRAEVTEWMSKWWEENPVEWWNDGKINRRSVTKPGPEWIAGRLPYVTAEMIKTASDRVSSYKWWTDGLKNKRSSTSPGPEWKLGRLKNKNPHPRLLWWNNGKINTTSDVSPGPEWKLGRLNLSKL